MAIQKRICILSIIDAFIIVASVLLGYGLVFESRPVMGTSEITFSVVGLLISYFLCSSFFNLYKKAWEYASISELIAIFKTVTISCIVTMILQYIIFGYIYTRVFIVVWMIHLLLLGASRLCWRLYSNYKIAHNKSVKRTLVVGAGSAGVMIVHHLLNHTDSGLHPVAFIDDDLNKQKLQVLGIPVLGTTKDIVKVAESNAISHIVIAIPSLRNKQKLQSIIGECKKTSAKTQIIPKIEDIMLGKLSFSALKDVNIDDLLGRDPVELDLNSIRKDITGKVVLVSGAGGSIGSEICRQVCQFNPKKILLLGHGENSIYHIDMELRDKYVNEIEIVPIIAEIQDRELLCELMNKYKPDIVYHAAAHKHVPLMEYNPKEAVKNNILGTKNIAEVASQYGVKNFVMISTDKAVKPTNVMGATKRFAEMIIQNLAEESATKFVVVRFGNVLGSRGSVVPLFEKQIAAGGPVTVTDPRMTRYFMTIPEAARLVIEAGSLAKGGEVFVLDMGKPVKIADLAKNMISLSGYTEEEIGIDYIGIRPGEKLYEELLSQDEIQIEQIYPKIHIGKANPMKKQELYQLIDQFKMMDSKQLKDTLLKVTNSRF